MIRFLHTADWQIGRSFASVPGDAAALLRRARIEAVDRLAEAARSHDCPFVLVAGDVFDAEGLAEVTLRAPYPNPVTSSARIPYELPADGPVRLAVYDALGRRVAVLADGDRPAGFHHATVDAARLAPGVYHVRLTAGPFVGASRFTVVR